LFAKQHQEEAAVNRSAGGDFYLFNFSSFMLIASSTTIKPSM
jgi:hypothetical protein